MFPVGKLVRTLDSQTVGNGSVHFMWTMNLPERDIICCVSWPWKLPFEEGHVGRDPTEFTWGKFWARETRWCLWSQFWSLPNHITRTRADCFSHIWQVYARGFILKNALHGGFCLYLQFTDRESESHRGEVTWSRSCSWERAVLGHDPRSGCPPFLSLFYPQPIQQACDGPSRSLP